MNIFSRKKKVTSRQLAYEIWATLVQIIQLELNEAKNFDRVKFYKENGWDYNKKKHVEENPFMYIFLIFNEVSNHFFESYKKILFEFKKVLKENEMDYLLSGIREYSDAWNSAIEREKKNTY
ncbi:MAG: hypothetical protein ACFFDN_45915 [Candidatus Hodarchaeota archaeon]